MAYRHDNHVPRPSHHILDEREDDDGMQTKGQQDKEREIKLLEIDLRSRSSELKLERDKSKSYQEANQELLYQIEQHEIREERSKQEMAFLKENLAEAKLYIVSLQETLKLKGAADATRISAWDVFRELYTTPAETTELSFPGKELRDEGTMIIADTIEVFTSLKSLNLSNNGIGKRGMEHLASQISDNATLGTLDLRQNSLFDDGCASVAAVISSSALASIHLESNSITCQGAAILCSALSHTVCHLTSLNLNQNLISEKGARHLCAALCKNTTLQFLSLAVNKLGDYGVTSLCQMLRINNTLTELNLSHNDIRQAGAADICSCLFDNAALRTLRMVGNDKMEAEGTKALVALRNSNRRDFRLYF